MTRNLGFQSPPLGLTVRSRGGNRSIHACFCLQLPSRPISLSVSHQRSLKSTRIRFRPLAICLCQTLISSLVPLFGNSKGELNTVFRPVCLRPPSSYLFVLSVYVKSDSNICSGVNQRRCPTRHVYKSDTIFFPETALSK